MPQKFLQIKAIEPEIVTKSGAPPWFYESENPPDVFGGVDLKNYLINFKSDAVKIELKRDASGHDGWYIRYKIIHSPFSSNSGIVWMTTQDVLTAFKLSNICDGIWGQEVLSVYGGEVAHQGRYIRYRKFLNIPGPGTGLSGDANVSIYVTEKISKMVEVLVKN